MGYFEIIFFILSKTLKSFLYKICKLNKLIIAYILLLYINLITTFSWITSTFPSLLQFVRMRMYLYVQNHTSVCFRKCVITAFMVVCCCCFRSIINEGNVILFLFKKILLAHFFLFLTHLSTDDFLLHIFFIFFLINFVILIF